ncbi:FAD-dependent monooxygenase [Hydrogenophaga sp. BPS33]|uniref:FAD-dependent monooxygenase n=1 Tax=Hydrogenophaga sp. BPS33 TaxID=2651974 RepID=UPI00131FF4BB|nr:FAD-dependent monooxygenase [Hydrogenophaga sp. BPS33]QHE85688.1 NAD(P)-binding protein [Hydrogenophaga sp. BPS33]
MAAANKVLVVGGGIGGMATAISLARRGVAVELIDLDPQWRVYGAGITITGATLRALHALGVLDAVRQHAYTGAGIQICDTQGQPLSLVPTPVVSAPGVDIPGTGGIMRPVLHRILADTTRALGVQVRLGLTVDALQSDALGVEARFSNGGVGRYDLVVGADGLFSRVRTLIRPDAPGPAFTGQYIWRVVAPRPAGLDRRHFFLGGPGKVGLTLVSAEQMYMFYLETVVERRPIVPDAQLPAMLHALLEGYGGPLEPIRQALAREGEALAASIVVRPLDCLLLPPPWHVGRVILIGDAAHPTTPQLASGAGMAVEDGLVLAEELERAASVELALEGFMRRRHARCQLVVENSLEIGRREQARAPVAEQTRLVEESLRALAEPI